MCMKKFGLFSKILVLAGAVSALSGCIFTPVTPSPTEKQLNVVDSKALKYKVGDVFNSYIDNGGLSVKVLMSNNSETSLAKGSYSLTISSKEDPDYYVNPDREFKNAGDYVVSVTRGKLDPAKYDIKVSEAEKQLVDISISDQKTSFVKDDTFTFGGKVMANYSDGTSEDVTSQATFSGYNLSNAGNQTVTVSFGGKSKTYSITVTESKILVTSVALDVKSKNLYVDDTFTVNATVLPSDATNKTLTWTSSNSIVATVSNGFITAKSAGSATITAKATDGSAKKATLTLIVSNKPVDVTGISLNKTTLSLKAGETAQLTATISPSNATDKAVNWSGSANGINVNSNGLVSVSSTATVGKTATIVATAHGNTAKTASCVVTVIETPVGEKDAWTVMIYMCGSTLEYDPSDREYGPNIGLASDDLVQILKSSAIPSDVNVLVETGGAGGWSLNKAYTTTQTTISSSKLQRWEVVSQKDSTSNNKLKPIETLTTNQMATQSSFQSFLNWGLTSYPAENTGVILWNHGGALAGVCCDENYSKNTLNTIEVAKASENALAGKDIDKMTFIGYDACLMGVADIASVNASYYDYMVASEESEPGKGWDYTSFLNTLYSNKTNTKSNVESILDKICSSFVTENCDNDGCGQYYPGYGYYYCYSTLAVYDLSKMDTLVSAFETYATNIKKISGYYSKIVSAFSSNSNYVFGEGLYGTCDFIKFLGAMDSKFSSVSSTNLRSALNSLVIAKYNCDEYDFTPCGICAFVPEAIGSDASYYGLQCSKDDYTGAYASKFSTWQSMMLANW